MSSSYPPTPLRSNQDGKKRSSNKFIPTRMLVLVLFSAAVSFYAGFLLGGGACSLPSQCNCNTRTSAEQNIPAQINQGLSTVNGSLDRDRNSREQMIQERINKEVSRRTKLTEQAFQDRITNEVSKIKQEMNDRTKKEVSRLKQKMMRETITNGTSQKLFDRRISDFVVGATRVNRDDFAAKFDTGGPLDPSVSTNHEVLILYSHPESLPKHQDVSTSSIPLMSVDNATDTCDYLHVVLTQQSRTRGQRRQCIAIMGQYESFHLQRFIRLPKEGGQGGRRIKPDLPLRLVPRTAGAQHPLRTLGPEHRHTNQYWPVLARYLSSLDSTLARLKPVVKSIAVNNTVVALVCNHGQSELLMNFICNARTRGLDLMPVLVFATDPETRDLAEGLGLTVFYDEINYSGIPKEASGGFGDTTFGSIVLAKVYCVQIISMLGYDILFQDVDVIWYRNPLEFFHNMSSSIANYDIYFQDDGNRGNAAYLPYCPNAGFYYVRNSQKTRNLLNNYLMSGDFVISSRNDQHVLSQLLQEHASLFGLRVKTLHDTLFPTGYAYQMRKDYMKGLISGDQQPYVFHMSWTQNKTDKIRYYQQMGEWFVVETCMESTAEQIRANRSLTEQASGHLISSCCSAEAIFRCHYNDRPSKIPCHDSPMSSRGGHPFW